MSTFYSPLTEIREDVGSESRSPTPTIDIDGWGEDWIKLVLKLCGPRRKANVFVL